MTIPGFVPAIGENDPDKFTRSIRNLYEYLSGSTITAPNLIGSSVIQVFAASGTYTPTAGMVFAILECLGAGGGGGGTQGNVAYVLWAGGGGAGSYSRAVKTKAQIGASQVITIGAGGSGGSAGANPGSTGGDTSIGSLCVGKGGLGGGASTSGAFGAGGTGGATGTGDFKATGQNGQGGFYFNYSATPMINSMGKGADSMWGSGGAGGVAGASLAATGNNATLYGAGGGGGASNITATNAAGGNGSAGVVIVTEFIGAS